MNSSSVQALSAAVLRILRPLVRILLRSGVSYNSFADLAKWVYVDVATQEFGIEGRKQSTSRVSVLTGLSRKEVSRVRRLRRPDDRATAERYNRAARVITPSPTYTTHSSSEAAHAGQPPVCYPLDPRNRWHPDPGELRRRVRYNPAVAGVLLINPDNPTGAVYPESLLREIVAVAGEFGCGISS